MTRHRRRALLFTLLLITSIAVVIGLGLWSQRRQYTLDRQLIAALLKGDIQQAAALVEAGADPNTPLVPPSPPSLRQLWNFLLHRSHLPGNDNQNAFLIACGAYWNGSDYGPDAPQLTQAMLRHNANPNAKDEVGWTPLLCAIRGNQPKTVGVLLDYGTDANAKDNDGWTPLIEASHTASAESVRQLLAHGAAVNAQDDGGSTALQRAVNFVLENDPSSSRVVVTDIIPQLLQHGANPNLPDKNGTTALKQAQSFERPDLVALLRRAGAKK